MLDGRKKTKKKETSEKSLAFRNPVNFVAKTNNVNRNFKIICPLQNKQTKKSKNFLILNT